jgi:putative transposon-encoded protein
MKKLFLLHNKDAEEAGEDLTARLDEIDWDKWIDPELSFPENRQILNGHLGDIFEVGSFTLYPKDTRESEEQWLMQEKGWRIHKEQTVKTHRVKGYEYGSAVVSLPKGMVGHRVVLAVLDLTAGEEQQFREFEKGEGRV